MLPARSTSSGDAVNAMPDWAVQFRQQLVSNFVSFIVHCEACSFISVHRTNEYRQFTFRIAFKPMRSPMSGSDPIHGLQRCQGLRSQDLTPD
ncbi:hypothetical protein AB1N83_009933 [Pleurotus pulmonarius]